MPPKDEPGLFSRVVRFVKNPTSWADLDQQELERESSYSKQMLKEMIERKRRNDFVRKREFDMLRKMRRTELMAGQDPAARPSFFQSSMPSKPDDRATTLKKIDEIEAQMSMQWWKTKHGAAGDSSMRTSGFPVSSHMPPDEMGRPTPAAPALRSTAYTRTEPQELQNGPATLPPDHDEPPSLLESVIPASLHAQLTPATPPAQPSAAAPLAPMAPPARASAATAGAAPAVASRTPIPAPPRVAPSIAQINMAGPPSESATSSAFSASKLFAIDVEEFAHDPELEEASIRFANGDDDGAEAGLREALAPTSPRVNHDETWLTLFDFYRATGRQEKFEPAAIEFANRFGRSAPQWFSMPQIVGRLNAPVSASPVAVPAGAPPQADWNSPVVFGTQTVAAMNAALNKAPAPWRLNWSKLTTIQDAAIEPLTRTFTQWASQPVQLRFIGAEALEKLLKDNTPSGDGAANPAWWKLRMEMLRVMHRPDEFELVALDYCVTYEVSPPSWEAGKCEYKALSADGAFHGGQTLVGEGRDTSPSGLSAYGDTQMPSSMLSQHTASVELSGEVLGDATGALDMMEARLAGADFMIINCARLIRIDFSAAGTLLNWVTARQSEGHQVQFTDVHRLVAAFFNVIGISEHARVVPRLD